MGREVLTEGHHVNGVAVTRYIPENPTKPDPIIMVHGGLHAGWEWDNWARYFAGHGYEVHVLDWYNHGGSEHLPQDRFVKRGIADIAKEEISFVAKQLTKPPIIIGHSMGALASAVYATMAPVEKLVLVTPVLPAEVGATPMGLPIDLTQPFPPFPYPQTKQLFFTALEETEAQRYYERFTPESPQAVSDATQWTVTAEFTAINAPTLVLSAELDQLIPADPLQRFIELLNAESVDIAGVGHTDVLLKAPEWEVAAAHVNQWLETSR